jgi:hypothetical protein
MARQRQAFDDTFDIGDTYNGDFYNEPNYAIPRGNTGVSGYGTGGIEVPPLEVSAPAAPPIQNNIAPTTPPNTNAPGSFTPESYAPIQGFDFDKITGTKQFDSADKYSDALRAFSRGLGSGGVQISKNNLDPMIQWLKDNGFGSASAVGDDKIDFGDGQGPIDVLTSGGDIWFQNGLDRFAPPGGNIPDDRIGAPGGPDPFGPGGGAIPESPTRDIMAELEKLFPDGLFNQGIVNRRVENASEALGRQAKSRTASNRAMLADRGLIGSGPEQTAQNRMEDDLFSQYSNAVSGIYANESENADSRMMQALGLAAGLSEAEMDNMLGWFRAQSDDRLGQGRLGLDSMLGRGNLALGNMRATNDYNLGLGQQGLDRDRLLLDVDQGDMDNYIKILELLLSGAGVGAGGYI